MPYLEIQEFKDKVSKSETIQVPSGDAQLVIGTNVTEPETVQVTAYGNGDFNAQSKIIVTTLGQPDNTLKLEIAISSNPSEGFLGANIVEYVRSVFPTSTLTPEFRKKIQDDFLEFESIYAKNAIPGHRGWVAGWTVEDQDHSEVKDEKSRSFVVVRGWDSMKDFQAALETPQFKEAIPILFGWGAPHKMVSDV